MIYTVTLNPALDKTVLVPQFTVDEVNRVSELRSDPGGKGINVSKVIAALGGSSKALALLGGNTGKAILSDLNALGVDCTPFWVKGETRTNLKVVDPELGTNTDINEPGPEVSEDVAEEMLAELQGVCEEGDIVVLSGSLPKGLPNSTYATWIDALQAKGAKCFLDVDGEKLEAGLAAKPFMVKPNETELGAILGREIVTPEEAAIAARELVAQGIELVVISMGSQGAVVASGEQVIRGISPKVEVGSTVGAGDSVVAAFAYATEQGLSLEDATKLAMACGAANVMQSGTQAAPKELVDELIGKVELKAL